MSHKKKKYKKSKAFRKSDQKKPTVKRCWIILDLILELKPFRSQVKGKHSKGREFQRYFLQAHNSLQTNNPSWNFSEYQSDNFFILENWPGIQQPRISYCQTLNIKKQRIQGYILGPYQRAYNTPKDACIGIEAYWLSNDLLLFFSISLKHYLPKISG